MDITIPDGLPYKFFKTGKPTYNQDPKRGMTDTPYCQPAQKEDKLPFQFITEFDGKLYLQLLLCSTDEIIVEQQLLKTTLEDGSFLFYLDNLDLSSYDEGIYYIQLLSSEENLNTSVVGIVGTVEAEITHDVVLLEIGIDGVIGTIDSNVIAATPYSVKYGTDLESICDQPVITVYITGSGGTGETVYLDSDLTILAGNTGEAYMVPSSGGTVVEINTSGVIVGDTFSSC